MKHNTIYLRKGLIPGAGWPAPPIVWLVLANTRSGVQVYNRKFQLVIITANKLSTNFSSLYTQFCCGHSGEMKILRAGPGCSLKILFPVWTGGELRLDSEGELEKRDVTHKNGTRLGKHSKKKREVWFFTSKGFSVFSEVIIGNFLEARLLHIANTHWNSRGHEIFFDSLYFRIYI